MVDFTKANFGSPIDGDKIVDVVTGTFTYSYTTAANGGVHTIENPQPGTKFLPISFFSVDNGATWFTDMEGDGLNGLIDFMTGVTEDNIHFRWNFYGPSGSRTVRYRTALLLIEDIDNTDRDSSTSPLIVNKANSKLNLEAYDSGLNYRRIIIDKTYTIGANGSLTVPHRLGYTPYYRAWAEMRSGEISHFFVDSAQYRFTDYYFNNNIFGFDVTADGNNIYIVSYSPSRKFYLRVYEG